jgi:hypothetical protein
VSRSTGHSRRNPADGPTNRHWHELVASPTAERWTIRSIGTSGAEPITHLAERMGSIRRSSNG